MSRLNLIVWSLICLFNPIVIDAKCGQPEIPFLAINVDQKDAYEEGEKIRIECKSGVLIKSPESEVAAGHLYCYNYTWHGFGYPTHWHCSTPTNFTTLEIHEFVVYKEKDKKKNTSEDVSEEISEEANEVLRNDTKSYSVMNDTAALHDNNLLTSKRIEKSQTWVMHLNESKLVSHVTLTANYHYTSLTANYPDVMKNSTFAIRIETAPGHLCLLENTTHAHSVPVAFHIYKCPITTKSSSAVSIGWQLEEGSQVEVCEINIFSYRENECNKPALPLNAYSNLVTTLNQTQYVKYICSNGYTLIGNHIKVIVI